MLCVCRRPDIATPANGVGLPSMRQRGFYSEVLDAEMDEEVEDIPDLASDHGEIEDDGEDDDMTVAESVMDTQKDAAEEKRRLRLLADEDAQFPDEMDTPEDVAARERFAR